MPAITITELNIYPIKSCGGYAVQSAAALQSGLEDDRTFMVVDADTGHFVTQRQVPQMALIKAEYRMGSVQARAPGMMRLDLPLDVAGEPLQVTVWDDTVGAFDMGDVAAQWFSDFLRRKVRLARFDPDVQRLSASDWPGGTQVPHQFADGFPLLVISRASLTDLNERLAERGIGAMAMNRFRPNIVIDGLDAFDEDYVSALQFGDVTVQLTRPCGRCEIPNTNQETAERLEEPMRTLSTYRVKADHHGLVCVGMNGYFSAGFEAMLTVGQAGVAELAF
jgi:uncharacterized protein